MCPPLSFDHRNIEINNTEKPSLCTCQFIGNNQVIGTRTIFIFKRFASLKSKKCKKESPTQDEICVKKFQNSKEKGFENAVVLRWSKYTTESMTKKAIVKGDLKGKSAINGDPKNGGC